MTAQSKGNGVNSFNEGLNTDTHPLVTKNTQLIDALNAEILTVGDNQYVLKNIPGSLFNNTNGFSLTAGFIPLAVKTYNNVAYIISAKFAADGAFESGELGTFPSPVWSSYAAGLIDPDTGVPAEAELITNYTTAESHMSVQMTLLAPKEFFTFRSITKIVLPNDVIGRSVKIKFKLNSSAVMPNSDVVVSTEKSPFKSAFIDYDTFMCNDANANELSTNAHEGSVIELEAYGLDNPEVYIQAKFKKLAAVNVLSLGREWFAPCSISNTGFTLNKPIITPTTKGPSEGLPPEGLPPGGGDLPDIELPDIDFTPEPTTYFYDGVEITDKADAMAIATISVVNQVDPPSVTMGMIAEFYARISYYEATLTSFPLVPMPLYHAKFVEQLKANFIELKDLNVISDDTFSIDSIEYLVPEYEGEEGFQNNSKVTDLVDVYAPLHNFLTDEFGSIDEDDWDDDTKHIMPFRTAYFNFNINDFVDLTLQKEYDESVNFIFTDDRNPIRLINSRFRVNENGTATIIDRRQSKDTNTYSSRFFNQTELILKSTTIPKLEFVGVDDGGILFGGGYRYYFRHKNSDGNLSDIIAESRLVSVHFGMGETAYGVAGDKKTNKMVKFSISGLDNTAGSIQVSVVHVSGDIDSVAQAYTINNPYNISDDGICNITHIGIEDITIINESTINTAFSSISTAKTLDQINNRLVIANIASNIDEELFYNLEAISKTLRIWEDIVPLPDDESGYGDPQNVYNNLGHWGGETYELAIVYVLTDGSLTPAYPVRGIDNYDGNVLYSGEITSGDDVIINTENGIVDQDIVNIIPSINPFENVRGLYRTKHDKYLVKDGVRQVTKLTIDVRPLISSDNPELAYYKERVIGYFVVRKDRLKDTLYQGFVVPTAMMPVNNVEGVTGANDFVGFKRNTAVVIGTDDPDATKFYLGWDNNELNNTSIGAGMHKESKKVNNLYDLVIGHVPQYSNMIPLIHPSGTVSLTSVGRTPRTDKVAFYSGDMEVDSVNMASLLDNAELNVNINLADPIHITILEVGDRIQTIPSTYKVGNTTYKNDILNTEGNIKYIGKMSFVSSGRFTVADREFTGQIDRSMSYLSTSYLGTSPWMKYNQDRGWSVGTPATGYADLEIFRTSYDTLRINFTDEQNNNRYDYLKAAKKGDYLENDKNTGFKWNFKQTPSNNSYFEVKTGERERLTNDHCTNCRVNIRIVYNSPGDLDFFPVITQPDESVAKGFGTGDSPNTTTTLWPDGDVGINKTANWEVKGSHRLFPYSSVVHNYSNYVGIELDNPDTSLRCTEEECADANSTCSEADCKAAKGTFNHKYEGNFVYLSEIKSAKAVLTSDDLVARYGASTSVPYYSVTERVQFGETNTSGYTINIADGDCFITRSYKRTTYAIGIPDAPAANAGDYYTYGTGPIQEYLLDKDTGWGLATSYEEEDEGRKLLANGQILELVSQTNHNVDVRSTQAAEPVEDALYGSDRGFYPKTSYSKLYSEYRPDSIAYNRGLTGDYRSVSYVGIDVEAPSYKLNYPNRIMISSPNIQSEFFNGYRDISGLNFRDYNSELGQIMKVINFDNILFCVFESGIAVITVDGRTLINSESEIYVDDAQVLATKARVLSTTIGTVNPESVISTFTTIYGVDFVQNKVWRVAGTRIDVLSDYKIEQYLINAKKYLLEASTAGNESISGKPRLFTTFDSVKKNIHISYNKLMDDKANGFFTSFGTVYFNEVMNQWVSRVSYTPKFQMRDKTHNMSFDLMKVPGQAWTTGTNNSYCNFIGAQYPFELEFIMHERPDIEKILTNLQLLSNKIKPESITYTITGDVPNAALRQNAVNYYDDNGDLIESTSTDYTDPDNVSETVFKEDIYIREDSFHMSIGIFSENAYYKDGKYFIQVGKTNSFSRFNNSTKRIRDKYFKIKIKYSGEDYVYLYSVISLFTSNYD